MEGFGKREIPKIEEDADGNLNAFELGDSIIREGSEIINNDPRAMDMIRTRESIQAPDAKQKMHEGLLNYLKEKHPKFNWRTYFDLIDKTEEDISPTIH